ncbi:MAG: enoyl-CoA hydratase/isomerase family protein [Cognatishimia sp.]|uniref:enoyl-CoA hydratase/isomerase family protein n=1 Tax=Cognatishimia sp. TaxID=2211648 RepID=UPI0040591098
MSDINIRKIGRTGRITLTRPQALNALSYPMCLAIEDALDAWATDDDVAMVIIDAEGDRAFCAGGDIQEMYDTASAGDFAYGRRFWADEYRMNAKMFDFPKPVATFMQGFTMGGGVGVGCHGSHRVVGESSQVAMPEVGIGLVPDVGGSYILAKAPGHMGEYLGLTAARMSAGDAITAGFADYFIREEYWPQLIKQLEASADYTLIDSAAERAPEGPVTAQLDEINRHFAGASLLDVVNSLTSEESDFTAKTLKLMRRNSPLAMGAGLELIRRGRAFDSLRPALEQEYRFTYRSAEHGEFIEGIRAAIIDKDRNPKWQNDLSAPPADKIVQMLMPLGQNKLTFEKEDHT